MIPHNSNLLIYALNKFVPLNIDTPVKIITAIKDNQQKSRREWMLWMFGRAGKKNVNNKNYQFWRQDNKPIELFTNEMMDQKLDYIHNNPVEEGLVLLPEEYLYSSAKNYSGMT